MQDDAARVTVTRLVPILAMPSNLYFCSKENGGVNIGKLME